MPNWNAVFKEIQKSIKAGDKHAHDNVRHKYLLELHKHTDRNVIAYYSGFLTKPDVQGVGISDEDKNGFMSCIHQMDRSKGLDLLLHTGGGNLAATESLVHYLKEMFGNDIRAIITQIAMSAGTLIACSCDSILMGKHSNIGPVDPQIKGIPCVGAVQEVQKAYGDITKDPLMAHVWQPILNRYAPSFLQQCEWAIQRSEEFLREALKDGMLKGLPDKKKEAAVDKITTRLTDLNHNKAHERHIHYRECIDIGLTIQLLEDPADKMLQDRVLTVHHCFMHTLANTGAIKIIEDHRGRSIVKVQQQHTSGLQIQLQPQPS